MKRSAAYIRELIYFPLKITQNIAKLILLRIDTWSYNCLLRIIIISFLKPYKCVQVIGFRNTWNYIIIDIR